MLHTMTRLFLLNLPVSTILSEEYWFFTVFSLDFHSIFIAFERAVYPYIVVNE